jgi:hypothetical protein
MFTRWRGRTAIIQPLIPEMTTHLQERSGKNMHVSQRICALMLLALLSFNIISCSDTSTSATISNQPSILGSSLSAFDARFGERGTTIDDKGGSYTWKTKYGSMDLYIDTLNSASLSDPAKNLVNGLLFSFPYASTGNTPVLTSKAALELSRQFLPNDAVHIKDTYIQSSMVNGEEILVKTYESQQLSKILPATSFIDHNDTQLKKGLITILFSLNNEDKNQITDVTVQTGEDLPKGFNL